LRRHTRKLEAEEVGVSVIASTGPLGK